MTNDTIKDREAALDQACYLYDGGWRPEDREDMIWEYGLTEHDADLLIEALECLVEDNAQEADRWHRGERSC